MDMAKKQITVSESKLRNSPRTKINMTKKYNRNYEKKDKLRRRLIQDIQS